MKNIIPEQKTCPFCGQESTLQHNPKIKKYKVSCDYIECFIQPETIYYEDPNDAVSAWNHRMKNLGKEVKI